DRDDEFERARAALQAIPADDRDTYLRIGMAIKSEFGDPGFSLHRAWAMRGVKFHDAEHRRTWASIAPEGGITIATLFSLAQQNGWRDQRRDGGRPVIAGGGATYSHDVGASGADDVKPWP